MKKDMAIFFVVRVENRAKVSLKLEFGTLI